MTFQAFPRALTLSAVAVQVSVGPADMPAPVSASIEDTDGAASAFTMVRAVIPEGAVQAWVPGSTDDLSAK